MEPPRKFKLVGNPENADFNAVRVTLFTACGRACGWFIAPISSGSTENYLPKSTNLAAALAVTRAIELADQLGLKVCVIDPDALWSSVWPNG